MDAYSDFAAVYDIFMDETPYEEWESQIITILKENKIEDGLLLDLGCGTGSMTQLLAKDGYDMIGVDLSMDMLNIARQKQMQSGLDILYLCQDMREFELYGTVRAVVMVCDSINYLLEDEDVITTFRLVNNYLDAGGIFVFDFNTVHKYRDVIGDKTIAENRENCSFIWDNYYDAEKRINEYQLTIYVREDLLEMAQGICYASYDADDETDYNADNKADNETDNEADSEISDFKYVRVEEQHLQKGYELSEMLAFLEKAGMEFIHAYDTDTGKEVTELTERVTVIAKEKFIEGKYYG